MTVSGAHRSGVRFVVVAAFCVVAATAYLSRNCLGVFAADEAFLAELGASEQQLSNVMTSFFIAYGIFQIPAGWLGQKFGSRIVLTVYAATWSVCTAMLGLGGTAGFLTGAMFAIGAAQAGVVPNAARSISDWMPAHRKAMACGFMAAFMSIGGATANALTGELTERAWTWQSIVFLYSVPGIVWAVVFYIWFRDRPQDHSRVSDAEFHWIRSGLNSLTTEPPADAAPVDDGPADDAPGDTRIDWRSILTSKALWLVNGQQFFRAAGYIFYATWFPTFLRKTYEVSVGDAALLSSLPLLAVVAGSSLGGIITDVLLERTGSRAISRKLLAAACLTICGLLTVSALAAGSLRVAMTLIVAGSFCASLAGPCAYAQTMDLAGKQIPVVFGMMNMLGNFGAALCPQLVTGTVALTGSWQSVLYLFLGIYLAGANCWALLDTDATLGDSRPQIRSD